MTRATRRDRTFRPSGVSGTDRLEARCVPAASLPAGFTSSIFASGIFGPTAMEFAPDGRIFVAEQQGDVKIVRDGQVLPESFLHLDVFSVGERGLLGLTLDPNFATNGYVYVFYTTADQPIRNRVSRFTADGDRVVPVSEKVLLDLDPIDVRRHFHHCGGAMHFGADGKLYIATGDLGLTSNSQTLRTTAGKILRINSDGSIPTDNPFYGRTTGVNRAIWAYGLRNPFTFSVNKRNGRIFINDVGLGTYEEVNVGRRGANYGWPKSEGPRNVRGFARPFYTYMHGNGPSRGCAITGGTFYDSPVQRFPAAYRNSYFFGDYCSGSIRGVDVRTGRVTILARGVRDNPIDLDVDSDGNLYYLGRGDRGVGAAAIYKIEYAPNSPPKIGQPPADAVVRDGETAAFHASVSGTAPLSYQWQKNGQDIPGATSADLNLGASLADDGTQVRVIVSNAFGTVTSSAATLHVTTSQRPAASVTSPEEGARFAVGQIVTFTGIGTDPEDGDLPASVFTWRVDLDNHGILHPIVLPTSGVKSGAFAIPSSADLVGSVSFRITLTVHDSSGLTTSVVRTILPRG